MGHLGPETRHALLPGASRHVPKCRDRTIQSGRVNPRSALAPGRWPSSQERKCHLVALMNDRFAMRRGHRIRFGSAFSIRASTIGRPAPRRNGFPSKQLFLFFPPTPAPSVSGLDPPAIRPINSHANDCRPVISTDRFAPLALDPAVRLGTQLVARQAPCWAI